MSLTWMSQRLTESDISTILIGCKFYLGMRRSITFRRLMEETC